MVGLSLLCLSIDCCHVRVLYTMYQVETTILVAHATHWLSKLTSWDHTLGLTLTFWVHSQPVITST